MSLLLRFVARATVAPWTKTAFSTTSIVLKDPRQQKEAPFVDANLVIADEEERREREKQASTIVVPVKVDLSPISGIPEEHVKERRVRIFMPAKNAMQSGTDNTHHWSIEFDNRERWENPLMGWSSSGDPLSNMRVEFGSADEAISHCERNGWRWFVDKPEVIEKSRVKNYGVNFSWNKRTRVSTK
ncbi:NADH dehydrogenase [ubiquinone] iron-sulfur protein 4, mitochondrial [Toxorhynchites rutilus septentrionalis]|uniref:NADH dehydrogenase [ubiquinone] iron-sulfur protein 4, mitochondrial n=1 Tax=Toxorhynchites rutilus septentrionalis TaxID=329112 RepID=UPI00247A9985|nr:NADH dehydrogenase [ubiquinone] iron-sulfur protein 4, mitochondrial [Toxorhynchites rutilus septentrionalis]